MKTWLKLLETELKKKYDAHEVEDVLSYYEEMIQERLDSGETIKVILADYDVKSISKTIAPNVLMNRSTETYQKVIRSTRQLLVALLSTPLWIPLGILYVVVLIIAGSMMLTSVIITGVTLLASTQFLIDMISGSLGLAEIFGLLGISMMIVGLMILFSVWLYKWMETLVKKLIYYFSKLAKRIGEKK
ncbi:MAG: DUF1700 domain-containing protein [Acholeplasmataceae bacterium]|nr:DUF1700 domain-containing protein [Acholeplasmataceae bacterium]